MPALHPEHPPTPNHASPRGNRTRIGAGGARRRRRPSATAARTLATVAAVAAMVASACGGNGDGTGAGSTSTPPPSTADPGHDTCQATAAGYELEYPSSWHTNSGAVDEPCHWFHPEPFELQPATEAPRIVVHLRLVDSDLATHVRRVTGSTSSTVLHREDQEVAGRQAVVIEARSQDEALLPAGTRTYAYYVALDGRLLAATTDDHAVPQGTTYEGAKAVLDRMMSSLRLLPAQPRACSAAGLSAVPERQPGLPGPVAETRRSIVAAATACDYERLRAIAAAGPRPFTASFGGVEDVVALWRDGEARGEEPLRYLVALLDRPHGRRQVEGTTHHVWPSAFAHGRWSDVPEDERDTLRPLYDDEDFRRFARFGGYTGYRVGIAGDGEWLFFVAGD